MKKSDLSSLLSKKQPAIPWKPTLFTLSRKKDMAALLALLKKKQGIKISDDYVEEVRELFHIKRPKLSKSAVASKFQKYLRSLSSQSPLWQQGVWAYFPWNNSLAHILSDREFQIVRTARNMMLIDQDTQRKFYDSTIGIAGLSVGNSIILTIVLEGGGRRIRLADYDRLALSNMNRIRAGVDMLGDSKAEITARQIYAIDPYAQVEIWTEGLTSKNISQFFDGIDVVIDEMDSIPMKFALREYAKKLRIPLVTAADEGDCGVVDVERYDRKARVAPFGNRLRGISSKLAEGADMATIGKVIIQMIGPNNVPVAMQNSLGLIGKSIVSWPQLGGTAAVNGAAIAFVLRRILSGKTVTTHALLSLEEKLVPEYFTKKEREKRMRNTKQFSKKFQL